MLFARVIADHNLSCVSFMDTCFYSRICWCSADIYVHLAITSHAPLWAGQYTRYDIYLYETIAIDDGRNPYAFPISSEARSPGACS